MIKISIIIPVYNVEKYIEKCLNSILEQSNIETEVILINDGSTDNSLDILKKYAEENPKIFKLINKSNGGQGSARNIGLEKAKGEYILYVDSDDYLCSNQLLKIYNQAKKTNADILVFNNYIVDEKNKIIKEEKCIKSKSNQINLLLGNVAVWNKLYKRTILENIKFRSKVWYEDLDFTAKIIFNNYKIEFYDEVAYNYLEREGSTMNNDKLNRNLEIILASEEITKYFKKSKKNEQYKDEIEFLNILHVYINTLSRIIRMNVSNSFKKIPKQKIRKYMKLNFKDFKKNKYIKYLSFNKKIILFLLNFRLDWVVSIIFKIKKSN